MGLACSRRMLHFISKAKWNARFAIRESCVSEMTECFSYRVLCSIISVMDGSLPRKPCRTCKNRFHAGCLFKVEASVFFSRLSCPSDFCDLVVQFESFFQLSVVSFRYLLEIDLYVASTYKCRCNISVHLQFHRHSTVDNRWTCCT